MVAGLIGWLARFMALAIACSVIVLRAPFPWMPKRQEACRGPKQRVYSQPSRWTGNRTWGGLPRRWLRTGRRKHLRSCFLSTRIAGVAGGFFDRAVAEAVTKTGTTKNASGEGGAGSLKVQNLHTDRQKWRRRETGRLDPGQRKRHRSRWSSAIPMEGSVCSKSSSNVQEKTNRERDERRSVAFGAEDATR
jgi:hypothetical protein